MQSVEKRKKVFYQLAFEKRYGPRDIYERDESDEYRGKRNSSCIRFTRTMQSRTNVCISVRRNYAREQRWAQKISSFMTLSSLLPLALLLFLILIGYKKYSMGEKWQIKFLFATSSLIRSHRNRDSWRMNVLMTTSTIIADECVYKRLETFIWFWSSEFLLRLYDRNFVIFNDSWRLQKY